MTSNSTVRIMIPGPLLLMKGGALNAPYYYTKTSDGDRLVTTLQQPSKDLTGATGFGLEIPVDHEDQPILIATSQGGYIVYGAKLRVEKTPIEVLRNQIMGVYPLHTVITFKKSADPKVVERLNKLVSFKQPGKTIFDY